MKRVILGDFSSVYLEISGAISEMNLIIKGSSQKLEDKFSLNRPASRMESKNHSRGKVFSSVHW